jgi:hypothetical protein
MYSEGLMGLKDDAMKVGKVGLGVVAGAGAAVAVVKMVPEYKFSEWVNPLLLIASGAAVYGYGKDKFPVAAPSFAAGWAAVGLGKLIGAGLKAAGQESIAQYVPFAGVDTYDSGLLAGLGYGGYNASVSRYMMQGSPTQVQQLMGAPIQVQALAGLGSSVLDGSPTQVQTLSGAPMSATLM